VNRVVGRRRDHRRFPSVRQEDAPKPRATLQKQHHHKRRIRRWTSWRSVRLCGARSACTSVAQCAPVSGWNRRQCHPVALPTCI